MKYICFVLLLCGAALGCEKQKTLSPSQDQTVPIRTARVAKESSAIQVSGTVRSNDVAVLASRTAGFVSRVRVYAGSRVKKNQDLILVDDRNLKAQLEKLKAGGEEVDQGIREARHQLDAAESQKRLALNTFERISDLYRKNAASKQEFEEAEARKQAADSSFQAAGERVAQVESKKRQIASDVQDVSASFGYVRIVAPFEGVVTSVPVDQGTFVNPGQTLVSMESSSYEVQFFVEESLLSSVGKGQRVSTLIPAISNEPVQAIISELSTALDTGTHTFQVKAELPHMELLKSGLSATVVLDQARAASLWIPTQFLANVQDIETVWVRQNSHWDRVLVKSGRRTDSKVEILSGLNDGDEVGLFEEKK